MPYPRRSPSTKSPPTATFKGREKELDELTEAIRDGNVAILERAGNGGGAKTALALKLAQRLAADYSFCTYKHRIRPSPHSAFNRERSNFQIAEV
jgi:hypothetical protein